MAEILKSLAAMTPAWLGEALEESGHSPPPVTSMSIRGMDGFTGAMGEVAVVDVSYGGDTDLPGQFVAKCPLNDDLARLYASVMLSYQREAGFYRDMASDVAERTGMQLARCYVNLFDPATHDATLLIERVHPADKGDILDGTTFERMRALVGDLARLHGAYYGDSSISEHDWLIDWHAPNLRLGIPFTTDSWNNWNQPGTDFGDFYPADLAELITKTWIADIEGWLQRFAARDCTFVHFDYELDNVLFRGNEPVIVDWQSGMISFPGSDLGWLFLTGHNEATLAQEPELIEHYRAELAAAGGPEWSTERVMDDLAWCAFYCCGTNHVPYTNALGSGDDRAIKRFATMLRGAVAAADRWGAIERISAVD